MKSTTTELTLTMVAAITATSRINLEHKAELVRECFYNCIRTNIYVEVQL